MNSPSSEQASTPRDKPARVPLGQREVTERGGGVIVLVFGCFSAFVGVYQPLRAAMSHEPDVRTYRVAAFAFPVGVGIGLIYLVFGDRAKTFMGEREKPSVVGWVIYGLLFLAGIAVDQWLRATLRGYGYGR